MHKVTTAENSTSFRAPKQSYYFHYHRPSQDSTLKKRTNGHTSTSTGIQQNFQQKTGQVPCRKLQGLWRIILGLLLMQSFYAFSGAYVQCSLKVPTKLQALVSDLHDQLVTIQNFSLPQVVLQVKCRLLWCVQYTFTASKLMKLRTV